MSPAGGAPGAGAGATGAGEIGAPGITLAFDQATVDLDALHLRWISVLHRVHDFGEEEFHLRGDRAARVGLLD